MSENEKREEIEEIIEKKDQVSSVTQNDDNSMEFSFKGGLIFENMALVEEDKEPEAAEAAEETAEDERFEGDEFDLPETFKIDEKYNTPATPDTPTTIFKTYVPTFTGVDYRMKDDPRPRPKPEPKPEEKKDDATAEDSVDPIAELEVSAEEAVEVSVKGREEKAPGSLNVFKFADFEAEKEKAAESEIDKEKSEINKLLTPMRKPEPTPEPVAEPEPEPIPEPTPEPVPEKKTAKDYSIPDPGDDLRVVDYGKSREKPKYTRQDPEGVSNEPPAKGKKKRIGNSEFNSQAERDSFKDAFLDSAMSIKIRIVVMTVIAVLLFVYENFIVTASHNGLGDLGIFPEMYGTIDFIFASVMFLIAIPETARAFKYLTYGRVLPELSIVAAYITECIYTLAINSDIGETHPLYGLLFGIFAIVTVLSAHYRVNADFTAFKVVSKNMEKQILDKKLTRTLTEENMALDGAVDEYKSRTSRIFRAAFISDFFKRTGKVSENTFASIIPMLISFAIALICGVVIFFLKGGAEGGLVPGVSGFTLVFLLSLPSFAILIHKLPYYDAQLCALDEDSTLVGETSYRSFSSVDVIAFEDTDIFGVDDVNLRRVVLYGDSNNQMEKTMKQMNALFAPVGGPLDLIFKKTLLRQNHPAQDVVIEADGVSGLVDGARVMAGTEEYMLRHNIAIPELGGKREVGSDTTKLMYAAENGEVYAKFYIRYSFSEQFTMLLPSIKAEGIVPLIYTRDPNISNELLLALSAGSDSMRVMKKYYPKTEEDEKTYRRVSAELVTYGDNINAINVILLTKKYKKFSEQLSGTELYAATFTAAVAAVLSILGVSTIPVIVYSIWQLAWCVVLRLASKRAFPRAAATAEKEENN